MKIRTTIGVFGAVFALGASAFATPSPSIVKSTQDALFGQLSCKARPQVARSINTMLKNKLIRYVDNESGVYLFAPTVPMTFLGLPIKHISGSDQDIAFHGVPSSRMVGTAPPHFIQIDIAAPASELRKRALAVGMVEAIPGEGKLGFEVQSLGSYLAGRNGKPISSIECAD